MLRGIAILCLICFTSAALKEGIQEETERFLERVKKDLKAYHEAFIAESDLYVSAINGHYYKISSYKYSAESRQQCPLLGATVTMEKIAQEADATIYPYAINCDIYKLRLKSEDVDGGKLKIIAALNPQTKFLGEIKNATDRLDERARKLIEEYADYCDECMSS